MAKETKFPLGRHRASKRFSLSHGSLFLILTFSLSDRDYFLRLYSRPLPSRIHVKSSARVLCEKTSASSIGSCPIFADISDGSISSNDRGTYSLVWHLRGVDPENSAAQQFMLYFANRQVRRAGFAVLVKRSWSRPASGNLHPRWPRSERRANRHVSTTSFLSNRKFSFFLLLWKPE